MVQCEDEQGNRVAVGLVNYAAEEAQKLCRKKSAEIVDVLGYMDEAELVHRDNMVLV
jgi:glutamate 5-kinase